MKLILNINTGLDLVENGGAQRRQERERGHARYH